MSKHMSHWHPREYKADLERFRELREPCAKLLENLQLREAKKE